MKLPTFEDFNITMHEKILDDGTKIMLFEKPNAPITMTVYFVSGAYKDPVGKKGLAHFTEHMIVAGTEKFPTKDKMALFIEKLGGGFSASTSDSALKIHLSIVDPEDLPSAFLLMNEMVNESLFLPKTLETERGSIIREIGTRQTDPGKMSFDLLFDIKYEGSFMAEPVLGTEESVNAITRDDIIEFRDTYLSSGKCVIVAAGGVTMDQFVSELTKSVKLRKSSKFEKISVIKERGSTKKIAKNFKTDDMVTLRLALDAPIFTNDDRFAFNTFVDVFGSGRASRLMQRLRYEKGLVYSAGADTFNTHYLGSLLIYAKLKKENLQEVTDIIFDELNNMLKNGITQEEFESDIMGYIKAQKGAKQTVGSWVSSHGSYAVFDIGYDFPETMKKVYDIKYEDVLPTAQKYLKGSDVYLSMCGDVTEDDVNVHF